MPLKDVIVTINIANPAPRIGLGRPVIFTSKTGTASYKEYTTLDALKSDFAEATPTYKKAKAVFEQKNRPDLVAVATYDADVLTSLEAFYNRPWHFALLASDLTADQVKMATFLAGKDFKLGAYQVATTAARTALNGKARTIILDNPNVNEHLDAAIVGALGSLPVGSITWKFKSLVGITPRYLTDTDIAAIDSANAIAYAYKGTGKAQTTDGVLADGEWIDVVHGQDWVKADMENEVQYALEQNDKVPFDGRGIGLIDAAATTTLGRGFNQGIIAVTDDGQPDYETSTLSRDQVDAQDRKARIYSGLSFEFGNAGGIHGARIKGQIII